MGIMRLELLHFKLQSGTSTSLESRVQPTMEEAKARIDAWYESGRLFFPKKRIRELGEQLKGLPATGGKIVIEDLNGDTIEGVVPKAEGKFAG